MASNGARGYYPPQGDVLAPPPLYGYDSPSSNYSPGLDSMASPQMAISRYRSIAPPAEIFASIKRPISDSVNSQASKNRNSTLLNINDSVAMHLLVETALGDSQDYDVLSFEEVEALKKETRLLTSRIESVTKKLALETKLRDAAQSLSRLNGRRPRGPEDSPRMKRRSIGGRSSTGSVKDPAVAKAEAEFAVSARKCEDLTMELWRLEMRSRQVQTQLLKHTAGILQLTHGGPSNRKNRMQPTMQNGMPQNGRPDSPASIDNYDNYDITRKRGLTTTEDSFDERSLYKSPENIDGLLDSFDPAKQEPLALQGLGITQMPPPPPVDDSKANETLLAVEGRLEELNNSLRSMIMSSNPEQFSQYPVAPNALNAQGTWVVEEQLAFLDQGLRDLAAEQTGLLNEKTNLLQRVKQTGKEFEVRLEAINSQVYGLVKVSQEQNGEPYPPPPAITGQNSEAQIAYLDEALYAVQQLNESAVRELAEVREKTNDQQSQSSQYDAVLSGLWALILSEEEDRRQRKRQRRQLMAANPDTMERDDDLSPDEDGNPNEPFTLDTFSRKVQWLVTKVSSLKDQQGILRRQIRQQRELNSKSDAEREEQVSNLTDQLNMAREQTANAEGELTKLIEEMGRLQLVEQQRGVQNSEALANEQKARSDIEQQIGALQADFQSQLALIRTARDAAEVRAKEADDALVAKDKELRELEGDVVRLQTEVTIARAELDGAYGTRAQRAADAEWNPEIKRKIEDLATRNMALTDEVAALQASKAAAEARVNELVESERALKQELGGMATDYEAFTRENIQMEKERDSYEGLIDALRSEKEKLELELSDERVRWLGMKSPGQQMLGAGPEMTSVRMLREDFRKMMRDRTAEGLKALRAEQEERRKLESLVRQLRKEQRTNKA